MTRAASFRAREAFISPSASCKHFLQFFFLFLFLVIFTSLISTRSTLIPHGSVASSRWFEQAAVWMSVRWTRWPQLRWDSECGSRQLHPRTR
uniref:Uncharacterized protein n=1 Tax=Poecilia latipinna TaxID=48699 RepID=A0A3B3U6P7_9TELE